jgi:Uma2 family endonuclease
MQTMPIDTTTPRLYRWTRQEVERLAELGAFQGVRVELIGGQIVEMTPIGPRHAALSEGAHAALAAAFEAGHAHVRTEKPLAIGDEDAPQPDAAVIRGAWRDYLIEHPVPAQTLLVLEVADSSVAYDLGYKADLYAAAGIADYWVVDVPAGAVVVLRAPQPDSASPTQARYAERRTYQRGEQITPLAAGAASIAVADLLP